MLLTGSFCGDLVTLLVTASVVLIGFYKWRYQYWRRKNVPYLEPRIPFGNVGGPSSREHISLTVKRMYDEIKSKGWKYGGIFLVASPSLLVVDLDLLKNIMTKDFKHFTDRGFYHNEKGDPLSAHLFNLNGTKWRNLRTKLTPTFTSGKMRMMFQTMVSCEVGMRKKIELESERKAPTDIKEVLGCFTTDIIGSCAFGLDCKTFEDENSPFREYGRKFFTRNLSRRVKRLIANNFTSLARVLDIALIPKDISTFFMKIVKDTVEYREQKKVVRNDFMQLLIDMKNDVGDGTTFTIEEIAAQCFVFFIAGFETSSTTMTFALYELAKHQDIQDRLREEIREVLAKHQDQVSYDAIMEMKYMNQVIDEALRKYPPAALIPRKCVEDYRIPGTDVVIEKGSTVLIPILAIHHDEEYYPEPDKFDPERFSEENKASRHSYAHIPFGEGPRICIGMRFGLMQTKVGLTTLLRNFKFTVNGKTKEPLKMNPNSLVLSAEGEVWLDAHKI